MTGARRLRITFSASVSDVLEWKFTPQQREVRVLPGETALAFYKAKNCSKEDIIGVATYSVTPGQVAPYFSKIQCFCFEGLFLFFLPLFYWLAGWLAGWLVVGRWVRWADAGGGWPPGGGFQSRN